MEKEKNNSHSDIDIYKGNLYEKGSLLDRFRDLFTLAAFTLIVAVISLLVMNFITYPMTMFAIKSKSAFNFIIKYALVISIIFFPVYLLSRWAIKMKKEGFRYKEIVTYFLKKMMHKITIFLVFILITNVLIALLYIMLSENYHFIYRITNI